MKVPEAQRHVNSDGWAYTVFARVTNNRGRIEFTFEQECTSVGEMRVPADGTGRWDGPMAVAALQQGSYPLGLVVKDEMGGQVGTAYPPMEVPKSD